MGFRRAASSYSDDTAARPNVADLQAFRAQRRTRTGGPFLTMVDWPPLAEVWLAWPSGQKPCTETVFGPRVASAYEPRLVAVSGKVCPLSTLENALARLGIVSRGDRDEQGACSADRR